jgi:hypothetical protein
MLPGAHFYQCNSMHNFVKTLDALIFLQVKFFAEQGKFSQISLLLVDNQGFTVFFLRF